MKGKAKSFFLLIFILLFTSPAHADFPIYPVMTLMNVPFIATVISAGILLAIVIFLEAYVLWRYASLSLFESFKLSFMANLYSTLIGACIAFAYSGGMIALFGAAIGARWFTSMFVDLSERTGKFTWLVERRKICFALFLFGGFGVLFLGIAMMPGHGISYEHVSPRILKELRAHAVFPGTILLLTSGFLLTCISEGYVIARKITTNIDKVIKAVLLMNMASYTVLLFLSIYYLLERTHQTFQHF